MNKIKILKTCMLFIFILMTLNLVHALDFSEYPDMLIDNNEFTGTIVVGARATAIEVISATDIATSIYAIVRQGNLKTELDREIPNPYEIDLISVGNTCNNEISAMLMGNPLSCTDGLAEGEGLIKLYNYNDHIQILVTGYSGEDVRKAAKVLSNWEDHNLQGTEIIVTGTVENPILNFLNVEIPTEPPVEEEILEEISEEVVEVNISRLYQELKFRKPEYDPAHLYMGFGARCSRWSYYDKPEPYKIIVSYSDFKEFVESRIGYYPELINSSESHIQKMYDDCLQSEPVKYTNAQINGQIYIIKIQKDDFLQNCLDHILPLIKQVKLGGFKERDYEHKAIFECETRRNFYSDNEERIQFLIKKYGEDIINQILNYRDDWFIEYLQIIYPYYGENCVRIDDPEDEEGYLIKCFEEEEECNGCSTKDGCYPVGYRLFINVPEYCTSNGEFHFQKDNGVSCINNYECKSNWCVNNTCVDKNLTEGEDYILVKKEIKTTDENRSLEVEKQTTKKEKIEEKQPQEEAKKEKNIITRIISFFKSIFS